MKKLKKLSLHNLSQAEMTKKEMSALTGGVGCYCSCICGCQSNCPCSYSGPQEGPYDSHYGGSSTADNSSANGDNSRWTTKDSNTNSSANTFYAAYNAGSYY